MTQEQAEKFVVDNEPLMWYIINRHRNVYEDLIDDYEGTCMELFWKYVRMAEPGDSAVSYICKCMYLELKRRAKYGYKRKMAERPSEFSIGKTSYEMPVVSIGEMLAVLDERERFIAEHLYEGYNTREIGEMLGVSHQRVSEIVNNIRRKYIRKGFVDNKKNKWR